MEQAVKIWHKMRVLWKLKAQLPLDIMKKKKGNPIKNPTISTTSDTVEFLLCLFFYLKEDGL